jgi:hypothetical protein
VTAASGARAFLHIGAPKTGTTYLQSVMRRNRKALAAAGVLYPGKRNAHFLASMDLRDSGFAGYRDPAARGAWQSVVRRSHKWRGDSVSCPTRRSRGPGAVTWPEPWSRSLRPRYTSSTAPAT